jgi:uncharacterized protein (DUF488 family)
MVVFTVGHSSRPLAELLLMLQDAGVEVLADIRRFPGSRRFPHFGQEALAQALAEVGLEYQWLRELGGRRKSSVPRAESANRGFEVEAFRNYADALTTTEMEAGFARLESLARARRTAILCAEKLFWQCHRRIVSDVLLARGWQVEHLVDPGVTRPHVLTTFAHVEHGRVTYPPAQGQLFES